MQLTSAQKTCSASRTAGGRSTALSFLCGCCCRWAFHRCSGGGIVAAREEEASLSRPFRHKKRRGIPAVCLVGALGVLAILALNLPLRLCGLCAPIGVHRCPIGG